MEKLAEILRSLDLDLAGAIRWQDARSIIYRTSEWHSDPELQKVDPIDILAVFEDEVRKAEKEAHELKQKTAEEKRRQARKARDDFKVRETSTVYPGRTLIVLHRTVTAAPATRSEPYYSWHTLAVHLPQHRL